MPYSPSYKQTLMVQGTTSDAGKSTLVAALGRWLQRQGISVAPFKPQNMSLNSAVTPEGGEIGRAQALQAHACKIPPHVDMNPVLLKPQSDQGAQIIVLGKVSTHLIAEHYQTHKKSLLPIVIEAYQRLAAQYPVILVEGAGSPAEINLRYHDIANMGFAEAIDCSVILISDIDRGGVFAHLVGTLALLAPTERARVKGFVINRFRGNQRLLEPGLRWLEKNTGIPVIGVLPHLSDLHLDAEDSLAYTSSGQNGFRIVVPKLPRMSNATDFDVPCLLPDVQLHWITEGQTIPSADLICLPGSKAVADDLHWLRQQGWEKAIKRHLRYGGKIIGICGGFQMLGNRINDPLGLESSAFSTPGLALLDIETTLTNHKILRQRHGYCHWEHKAIVNGYEIHAGQSKGLALQNPAFWLNPTQSGNLEPEGAISADQQILGTYLHGLFDNPAGCHALLRWAGYLGKQSSLTREEQRDRDLDRLADLVEQHLDTTLLAQLLHINITS